MRTMRALAVGLVTVALALAWAGCKKDPPPEEPAAEEKAAEEGAEGDKPEKAEKPAARPGGPAAGTKALAGPVGDRTAGLIKKGLPEAAPAAAPGAAPAPAPAVASAAPTPAVPAPAVAPASPAPPRTALPDLRLLLTANDVEGLAQKKATFHRAGLPGMASTDDQDGLYYEPEKGANYGFGIQVFRARDPEGARERYASMLASYPSATEIAPIAGKTFFAYWDEVMFVTWVQPTKNLVVVLSCGRKFCDSDRLYELAKKVGTRAN